MIESTVDEIKRIQLEVCDQHGSKFVESAPQNMLGFASRTTGLVPIHGLRHPVTASTTGWYVWLGEQFSEASDFFEPLHVWHIYEKYPETKGLLGLAPGYRFLVSGSHLDVWFDEQLLTIKE